MIAALQRSRLWNRLLSALIVIAALGAAFYLGARPSRRWLMLTVAALGGVALLSQPALGLYALVAGALVVPLEFGTGTEVKLNVAALLVPALLVLWLLDMIRRRDLRLVPSRANWPLLLFLLAGLLSLLVGNAFWDPAVPKSGRFIIVQLAQWAIFAFSAIAFWLAGNWLRDAASLQRLTFFFLALGGGIAILRVLPGVSGLIGRFVTIAFIRAPFWVLLAALAGGQLLFNDRLTSGWRLFLWAVLGAVFVYAFRQQQEAASNWVGVAAVGGVLFWLRFPRVRPLVVVMALVMLGTGIFFPAVYNFAGGDVEWQISGGSRLVLIQRVVEVTMRNPLTGLGPASYRPYANIKPLKYMNAYWVNPLINSHNNYVDLFAHVGILGLAIFAWFAAEVGWLGWQQFRRHTSGFARGYAAGVTAAWVGALAIMLLADWILPFVYNIGFPGFQASILLWLFLGGLLTLEQLDNDPATN